MAQGMGLDYGKLKGQWAWRIRKQIMWSNEAGSNLIESKKKKAIEIGWNPLVL